MSVLENDQKAILNEVTDKVFDLLGISKSSEDKDEDIICNYDYRPSNDDLNNFIPKLVINSKEISLWQIDKSGHSKDYYWRKKEFNSLENFVAFKTDYNIHLMAIRKIFQMLRESYSDSKTEGIFEKFFKRGTYASLKRNQKQIQSEIESDLIERREAFFLSDEFLQLKEKFEKNRKAAA